MPLLYYWHRRNYQRDLDFGASYHLNQANPLMHKVDLGDSLWAFTRTENGSYALAAELVVRAKTINPPNFHYGRYRIWGDLNRSRYFQIEGQPNIEPIIRTLSCRANAAKLGQSFQGGAAVRLITAADHLILKAATTDLRLEKRARLLPEDQLEAALLSGQAEAIERLISEEKPGIAKKRREYLFRQAPKRSRQLVKELQELYQGRCQICLWNPRKRYDERICHAHHIHWLSRGGDDTKNNMVLICPSHHAAIHCCDAPLTTAT
jgi:hypothetical protein